jgi:hypothetical protein
MSPVFPEPGATATSIFNTTTAPTSAPTAAPTTEGAGVTGLTGLGITTTAPPAPKQGDQANGSAVKEVDDPTQQSGKQKAGMGIKMLSEGQTQGAQRCSSYRGRIP